jgi:hypothetical protein
MKQSPFSEARSYLASQEISYIYWKPKVRFYAHKRPPLDSILSQFNPDHKLSFSVFKILFNIILSCTPKSPKCYMTFRFLIKSYYRLTLSFFNRINLAVALRLLGHEFDLSTLLHLKQDKILVTEMNWQLLIYFLVYLTTFSHLYKPHRFKWKDDDELKCVWKEAILICFKVWSQDFSVRCGVAKSEQFTYFIYVPFKYFWYIDI